MKKIDLYIIKKFLFTFIFTLFIFILIAIVIDYTEKVEDFTDKDIPFKAIVFEYYLNFIPFITVMLSPLFIFIAVIFFTSRMATRSEIIAILNGGMSFYRMLGPYMATALLLTGGLLYLNHYVVPKANKVRLDFENTYFNRIKKKHFRDIHMQVQKETFIYLENYHKTDTTGYQFTLEKTKGQELYYKLRATRITWNHEKNKWTLFNYNIRDIRTMDETLTVGQRIDMDLGFKPKDIKQSETQKEVLTFPELNETIAAETLRGSSNVQYFELEKHRRTASPFSAIILTLIGVSLASRKVRGGIGLHIAIGIGLSALYVLFLQISMTFTTNAGMPPLLGVWIPNIIFGLIAFLLLRLAPK